MANGFYPRGCPKNLAQGRTDRQSGSGYIRGHFLLDPDTFSEIRNLAKENNVSFSEQLRTIIVWGLDSVNS